MSEKFASGLYVGHVMHRRIRPRVHALRYRLFSLLLDLDEIDALADRLRCFSRGKFNLFAFHDRDHGTGGDESLRLQVERHLREAGIEPDGGAIRLLTMPRILGYAFNPLSVYFCHRRDGTLAAILYEVNNTFRQRHAYLLPVEEGAKSPIRQSISKDFHVSPFMAMDLRYDFLVVPPGRRLAITIIGTDAEGPIITAALSTHRRELSDGALLRVSVTHPLLTLKVVAAIGWEALKLWTKRVPLHRLPPPPVRAVTYPAIDAPQSEPQTEEAPCS